MTSMLSSRQEERSIPVVLVTVEGERVLDVRVTTEEFVGAILEMTRRIGEPDEPANRRDARRNRAADSPTR